MSDILKAFLANPAGYFKQGLEIGDMFRQAAFRKKQLELEEAKLGIDRQQADTAKFNAEMNSGRLDLDTQEAQRRHQREQATQAHNVNKLQFEERQQNEKPMLADRAAEIDRRLAVIRGLGKHGYELSPIPQDPNMMGPDPFNTLAEAARRREMKESLNQTASKARIAGNERLRVAAEMKERGYHPGQIQHGLRVFSPTYAQFLKAQQRLQDMYAGEDLVTGAKTFRPEDIAKQEQLVQFLGAKFQQEEAAQQSLPQQAPQSDDDILDAILSE